MAAGLQGWSAPTRSRNCTFSEFHARNAREAPKALERLKRTVIENGNVFAELIKTVRVCSLGQITKALFEVGGEYRRSM